MFIPTCSHSNVFSFLLTAVSVFCTQELEGTQHVVKRRRLSKKTKLLTSLRAGCQGRVEPSAEEAILRLAAMQPTAHASTTL
eukprot:5147130-Amphidinium_carterae.1